MISVSAVRSWLPATVTVLLSRSINGRRKGKACSKSAPRGKRCTLRTAAGTKRFASQAGTTQVAFGKGLRPGTYAARLSAGANVVVLRFAVR